MSIDQQHSLADATGTRAILAGLLAPFAPPGLVPDCHVVWPDAVTPPSNTLLVHHNHMTLVLERHYKKPVEVHVQEERLDGQIYTRKVGLTLAGTDRVVEWGVVRLGMQFLPPVVREDILAKKAPLGAVLIRHQVHRRIEPRHYVRFDAGSQVIALFGGGHNAQPVFGRIGTIYCDNEPAIELLEVVVNTDAPKTP